MLLGHCKYTDMHWDPAVLPPPLLHGAGIFVPTLCCILHKAELLLPRPQCQPWRDRGRPGWSPDFWEGLFVWAHERGLANHRLMEDQPLLLLLLLISPCRTLLVGHWKTVLLQPYFRFVYSVYKLKLHRDCNYWVQSWWEAHAQL